MWRRAVENCLPDEIYGKNRYISKLFQGNSFLSYLSLCCTKWSDTLSNQQQTRNVQVWKCSVLPNYFFQSDPPLLWVNLLCLAAGMQFSSAELFTVMAPSTWFLIIKTILWCSKYFRNNCLYCSIVALNYCGSGQLMKICDGGENSFILTSLSQLQIMLYGDGFTQRRSDVIQNNPHVLKML